MAIYFRSIDGSQNNANILVKPTVTRPVPDPLAVLRLDNRLCILGKEGGRRVGERGEGGGDSHLMASGTCSYF